MEIFDQLKSGFGFIIYINILHMFTEFSVVNISEYDYNVFGRTYAPIFFSSTQFPHAKI